MSINGSQLAKAGFINELRADHIAKKQDHLTHHEPRTAIGEKIEARRERILALRERILALRSEKVAVMSENITEAQLQFLDDTAAKVDNAQNINSTREDAIEAKISVLEGYVANTEMGQAVVDKHTDRLESREDRVENRGDIFENMEDGLEEVTKKIS